MNSNPNDRDRSRPEDRAARPGGEARSAEAWQRSAPRRKDAARSATDDAELPTHVVGDHQTD
jgi:hypothetical protein